MGDGRNVMENQGGTSPVYRAAVIGLGFVGAGDPVSGDAIGQRVEDLDGTHAQALAGHAAVRLVAGASRDEGRRRRFAERLNVRAVYEDWRQMLAAERPEIVSVALRTPEHAEVTIACAEAGVRAVLCEKAIATRLSDADRMIAVCRERRTLLAICHNRRWHPFWRSLRDELRAGAIGEVRHAALHWPTGRLGSVGTHLFDALRMLLGDAAAVSATLDPVLFADCRGAQYRDPGGWGIVAFQSGAKAFVDASQVSKEPLELRAVGSAGTLLVRANEAVIETWAGERRLIEDRRDRPNSLRLAVDEIVRCLNEGGETSSTGEDGRKALEVVIAFHVSDRARGRWTALPLEGADRALEVRIG
jgi:predicted dehydrogenase